MNYALVKKYNPAYDFFLFDYFRSNGIEVSQKPTLEEMERMALAFQNKVESALGQKIAGDLSLYIRNNLPPLERLFWDYARSWKMEPDTRPTVDSLFEGIFGGKMPDVDKLKELEAQLPPRSGKLLYSRDEAALDIVNFYKRYLRDPLRKALENGAAGRELTKYFSRDESDRLPDIRVVGERKFLEGTQKVGREVLKWIGAITPEKVARDVDLVLEEHRSDTQHIRFYGDQKKTKSCYHKSKYVELTYFLDVDTKNENLTLKPSRGFRVWVKHKWEPDYADAIFPEYTPMGSSS